MPTSNHIIQRHLFDIVYADRSKAHALQSRFSRLFDRESLPVMTEVFDRLIPESILFQLDTLVLDLGPIRADRLEKDFPIRLREALEKHLQGLLEPGARRELPARAQSLTDLLEYFLLTGHLPWWAAGGLLTDPGAVVTQLSRDDPPGLRRVLLHTGQQEYVRRRLVTQFSEETIHAMVRVLEPEEAPFILDYPADILQVQKSRPFIQQEMGEFRQQLWLFIFTYLLVDRGSNFNRRIFVRSTLVQLAGQYNMGYGDLIALLYHALVLTDAALIRRSALPEMIRVLFDEEQQAVPQAPPPDPAIRLAEQLSLIRNWLLQGDSPDYLHGDSPASGADPTSLIALFLQLIGQAPAAVHHLLAGLSNQPVWSRIVQPADEALVHALVRLRKPEEADFIFHYAASLTRLQRQHPILPTDETGFYRSIWELILEFIWTERGSLFNTRRFLEYNIRRIARRHQLEYGQLLGFLVEGIGREIRSERDSSLFHLLMLLSQESGQEEKGGNRAPMVTPAAASADEWLSDLDHYLRHGQWPAHWQLDGQADEALLLQQVLQWLLREAPMRLVSLLKEIGARIHPRIGEGARSRIRQMIQEALDRMPSPSTAPNPSTPTSPRPSTPVTPQPPPQPAPTIPQPDAIYIRNAGLILLHPLLPHFFESLGLTRRHQFIDEAARLRAAHLTQHLVDGRQEHPEQRLVLNKIICDIRLNETLPVAIELSDEEQERSTQLFQVLRERWPKMQNSSDETIRISFLQREGMLTAIRPDPQAGRTNGAEPEGWRLRVEQKGIDVLLQFLPWSWGIVRLPWMNQTIYTEWT